MSLNRQQKGDIAELKVQLRCIEKGFTISKPLVSARYDLIIDDGKKLWRTQIKYDGDKDKRVGGTVTIRLRQCYEKKTLLYTANDVDLILAYLPEQEKIVRLFPEHFSGKNGFTIRFEKPKRNLNTPYNWIDDFVW
jgi:hypothetical protein